MKDLYLSFPFKCLTFAATFPTAVLNKIFEHNSDAGVSEGLSRRKIPTGLEVDTYGLSSIAVGPKGFFGAA